MEKYIYNPKDWMIVNRFRVHDTYPDLSLEEIEKRAIALLPQRKKEIFQLNISRKLNDLYGYDENHGLWVAGEMTEGLPDKFYQNLDEWFDDKMITKIEIEGISVEKALTYADKHTEGTFHCAIMGLNQCLQNNANLKDEVIRAGYKCRAWEKLLQEYRHFDEFINLDVHYMLDGLPTKLFQNVEEWLQNKPFTNITIGRLSVAQIEKSTNASPARSIRLMNSYISNGCEDEFYYLNHGKLL